ncbi:MAG: CHAT domain-containing protein, partial [Cyanobacteriota bacterium]|nr:CHAT domain-containing protein [Cyanobacteriota bacterium]
EPPDNGDPVEPTPEPPDDNGDLIDPTPNPDPPTDGDPIIRDGDPPINPTPGPVLTPAPPFFPVVPTPSPSPTPIPPTPAPIPPSDDEVLSPSQAEDVTTVLEAELVDRKNRSSSSQEQIITENRLVNNSILRTDEVSTGESQTLTIQQNTDGSIALRQAEPAPVSVPLDVDVDINVDSGFDAVEKIELARVDVTSSLDSNNLEESVSNLEEAYSLDYLDYLGKNIADFETDTSAQEIQEKLREIDTKYETKAAIIYVFCQENELILMAVTAQGEVIKKSVNNISREQIVEVANQFRLEITDARKRYADNYLPFARQLYQWFVTPLEEEFKAQNIDTLLFVMDRGLRNLPLAALHDGEKFLIENYNFSLIPSFSLMHIRDRPLNNPQVLAMGASRFIEKPPLPAVPIEVESITKGVKGSYFLNEEFTIKNFKRQRATQSFNVIHLATHSEFNAGDADNSYIQFWDARLTVNNLKNFGWKWDTPPAELFVLSACRTAIGDEKAELGFAGLAIQAGVPSALASLWYVSDQGTLGLMVEFYNQLLEFSTIAEAFRAAQLAMLRGNIIIEDGYLGNLGDRYRIQLPDELMNQGNISFSHPYYWAGFTLIGSPW